MVNKDFRKLSELHGWDKNPRAIKKQDFERLKTQREDHSAIYPVKLPAKGILMTTDDGDIVADPFGGSGSTLIACEQTNRTCYMMELDPLYCDVIRKRYANFIGKGDKWQEITPTVTVK